MINEGNTSRSTLSHNAMLIWLLFCIVVFASLLCDHRREKRSFTTAWQSRRYEKKINIFVHSGKQSAPNSPY